MSKTIVITGASGGVGRGIALACGAAGWQVWIAARREHEGAEVAAEVTAAGGQGHFVTCDVTAPSAVQNALTAVTEASGRLDGIVHNATSDLSPIPASLDQLSLADLQSHIGVALGALHSLASYGFTALKQSQGSLLLMTSEAGFEGKAKLPAYAGVKGAQRGFARALAREWGHHGVRVNCLAPLAATPAMKRAFEHDPTLARQILGRNPIGHLGDTVLEIGPAARFLLSDDARYITGHTLMVDGGSCPAV